MKNLSEKIISSLRINKVVFLIVFICLLVANSSCIKSRQVETFDNIITSKEAFTKKTLAVLPLRTQSSLTTDSLLSLRRAINDNLSQKIKLKLPNSKIINVKKSVNILNEKNKLTVLDNLMTSYDSTGVFDKRLITSLSKDLKCDYIVFSRLKAQKISIVVLGSEFATSLEVLIIDKRKNDVVWTGVGDYKKAGIFKWGKVDIKLVADELTRLALFKL